MPPRISPRSLLAVQPISGPSRPILRFTSTSTQPPPAPKTDAPAKGSGTVPPLSRPLGTPYPPTTQPKSWDQRKTELLDDDRAKAKRKALLSEAKQGYFHDYNLARGTDGGKLWIAPNVLIREDKANYFPDISGKSLLSTKVHTTDLFRQKTTLVSIISTRLSEEHTQSFARPVLADLGEGEGEGERGFQYLTINYQSNTLKSLLVSLFIHSLKKITPPHLWGTYILSTGRWNQLDILDPLGLQNHLIGYTFLVDSNARVRWAGCGTATAEEVQALRRATAVLLGRSKRAVEGSVEGSKEVVNPAVGKSE